MGNFIGVIGFALILAGMLGELFGCGGKELFALGLTMALLRVLFLDRKYGQRN